MIRTMKYNRLLKHLLFWTLFLLYRLTSSVSGQNLKGDYWWGDGAILHILFIELLFKALFAYGVVYLIVPRYLDTKKYVQFAVFTGLWFYFVCALYTALHFYYMEQIYTIYLWGDKESMTTMFKRLTNFGFLFSLFSNFAFPAFLLGAIKFYKKKVVLSQVEEEKNKMELMVLKNQLNPHFLFNTLNNLYAYVMDNSPKAPDMILLLSSMLDYILYKSQNKSVPLKEELDAIESFIELEKIRYGDRLTVEYQTEGDSSVMVSPLLLLSLVENAFKHGASGDLDQPKITIEIKGTNKNIHCKVWNTKSMYKGELNDGHKEGIGLSNIKRQLDLIYPDEHVLIIDDQEKTFTVTANLNSLV